MSYLSRKVQSSKTMSLFRFHNSQLKPRHETDNQTQFFYQGSGKETPSALRMKQMQFLCTIERDTIVSFLRQSRVYLHFPQFL
jgi:hypothetical protein